METYEPIEALQKAMADKIIPDDVFLQPVKIIAGCDVEYDKHSDFITGAFVLFDYQTKEVIEVATHTMEATFPYIPGLFSFREMPPLMEAFRKLSQRPDIIICDGQGIAHPRGFGLAAHLGIELDIATIGCAKTRLYGHFEEPCEERGCASYIYHETEKETIIGKALRTQNGIKPVFVSIGHRISLESACSFVLESSSAYRLPETTREADHYARIEMLAFLENRK